MGVKGWFYAVCRFSWLQVEFGLKIIVKLFPNNVLLKWNKLYGLDFIDDF